MLAAFDTGQLMKMVCLIDLTPTIRPIHHGCCMYSVLLAIVTCAITRNVLEMVIILPNKVSASRFGN